ncbi:Fatty acid metabolism regulator protein [subsurface metagenome]
MRIKEMNKRKIKQRNHAIRVLEVAEKLFARRGFYPTTMDDIAKEAKLAKGTIYLYFDNKEDLFFSAIENKLDVLLTRIQQAVKKPLSPSQRIKLTIGTHLKFLEENRDYFKIMQNFPEGLKEKLERKLKGRVIKRQSQYIKIVNGLIQEAISKGELRPLDSRKLAVILMGIAHSLTVYWISQKEKGSLSKDESLAWEVFWEGARTKV